MAYSRQLAAIMFADIVGYTALMENDESLAMSSRERLKNKLEEVVNDHGGRLLEFHGDGALCSFTSTLESVKAATALQLEMQILPLFLYVSAFIRAMCLWMIIVYMAME